MSKKRDRKYIGRPQHGLTLPRPKRLLTVFTCGALAVVLFTGTSLGLLYRDLEASLNRNDDPANVSKLLNRTEEPPKDNYSGRAFNVLLIGSDTRTGEKNEGFGKEDGQRSDTTMLAHVSADRSRVQVISFPRDMMVDIPRCEREDGTHSNPSFGQFNWAYQYGGEDDNISSAVACTLKTVEELTELHIDEWVVADFGGFKDMITALGGIKVWADTTVYDANSALSLHEGCNELDGEMALAFARARTMREGSPRGRSLGDGSDLGRMKRQQRFMGIMVRTAKEKNLFTDFPALYAFGKAGLSALTTSEGLSSLTSLGGMAYSLSGVSGSDILFITIPVSEYPRDPNRLIPTRDAKKVWQALAEDSPLPPGIEARDANGNILDTVAEESQTPDSQDPASPDSTSPDSSQNTDSSETTQNPTQSAPTKTSSEPPPPLSGVTSEDEMSAEQLACEPRN